MKDNDFFAKIDYYLSEAYCESQKNNGIGFTSKQLLYKHGCVLVNNRGLIISRGYNRMSLNGDFKNLQDSINARLSFGGVCSVHAEVDCLSKLGFDQKLIKGNTLVIYGESKGRNVIKSRPCANCMRLLRVMRVKRIVYSNTKNTRVIENVEW